MPSKSRATHSSHFLFQPRKWILTLSFFTATILLSYQLFRPSRASTRSPADKAWRHCASTVRLVRLPGFGGGSCTSGAWVALGTVSGPGWPVGLRVAGLQRTAVPLEARSHGLPSVASAKALGLGLPVAAAFLLHQLGQQVQLLLRPAVVASRRAILISPVPPLWLALQPSPVLDVRHHWILASIALPVPVDGSLVSSSVRSLYDVCARQRTAAHGSARSPAGAAQRTNRWRRQSVATYRASARLARLEDAAPHQPESSESMTPIRLRWAPPPLPSPSSGSRP